MKRNVFGNFKTIWTNNFRGDVGVPEICYFSVAEKCKYERSGCLLLHSHKHYHWQVGEWNQWFNLPPGIVDDLEEAYCDPEQETAPLPHIKYFIRRYRKRSPLRDLRHGWWVADFGAMVLKDKSSSKSMLLRRLCTEKISGKPLKSNTFFWYFLDINGKWVKYGDMDTTKQKKIISNITSAEIEEHFQSSSSECLTFETDCYTYTLNFSGMIQTNNSTGVQRKVRRRPDCNRGLLITISEFTYNSFIFLMHNIYAIYTALSQPVFPQFWEPMLPKERVRKVLLTPKSKEYQNVAHFISQTLSKSDTCIKRIERIQNPCLWQAFQNKIRDMAIVYGDDSKVDVRHLFHGTSDAVIENIINENFDWRLHGTRVGQLHGQGTYFSTNADESYRYTKPDKRGYRYMFAAKVAVGSITAGEASMTRPPLNPDTKVPYDSTGSGSIIVKYDKQEYYPDYLITLT